MASSKRPTYKVETKLAVERKRRKSDLVIMWQSIWDVTVIIAKELWLTLIRMWEFIQLWFVSSERFLIQTWLEKYLPYVPEDFSESWRDGRLMAILLNKLRPGSFPDANRLDPDYGLKNVYRVFDALEIYFGIKPNVSVEEIVTCIDGSGSKLFEILLELKTLTDNQAENPEPEQEHSLENTDRCTAKQICIAKGTGLTVGFVGKTANFIICCSAMPDLDVVIEIRGPNSICSERITKRSPKKRRSVSSWEYARPLTRSASFNEDSDGLVTEEDENFEKRIIPLEYEILGNHIGLSYKPREKGQHKITILWHGQHILDSPYMVTVEDPSEITGISNLIHLKSALKTTSENGKNENSEKPRKISVRFQESEEKCKEQKVNHGKILSRRVLRYIVKIHGKDIPVYAENTESLATELLKMDYDYEKCPSFHRRNSWGFAGDAERKKSVIRQFCVDVNELDAQISQRRRSFSMNPVPKKIIQKSDSFDNLTSNLNIVDEVAFDVTERVHENEENDERVNVDDNEVKYIDDDEMRYQTTIGCGISGLSSKLTTSKFAEDVKESSSCERETDETSSLSTDRISIEQVDNSDEGLQSSILPYCPDLNESNCEKRSTISFNRQCSDTKLHHENKEYENAKIISKASKHSQVLINNKMRSKNSKMKKYANAKYNYSSCLKTRLKIKRNSIQTFYKKLSRSKNSVILLSIGIFRKCQGDRRGVFKVKKFSPNAFEIFEPSKSVEVIGQKFKCESNQHVNDFQNFCEERRAISPLSEYRQNETSSTHFVKEQLDSSPEQKKLTEINSNFRNITDEKTENISETSTNGIIQELKQLDLSDNLKTTTPLLNSVIETQDSYIDNSKPLLTPLQKLEEPFINHSLNVLPSLSRESEIETKDAKRHKQAKTLRRHTLKAIEQLNFKQFNASLETQSNISPVKLQIGHWESTLSLEKQNALSQKTSCASNSEKVSVKEKLAFWENAYKIEQNILLENNTVDTNRKLNLMDDGNSSKSIDDNSRDPLTNHSTGKKHNAGVSFTNEKNCDSINKETKVVAKIHKTSKLSAELQATSRENNKRSFSDPVILETAITEEPSITANFSLLDSSKNIYSNSSTDDNFNSDDSEDSGGDYILHSTEDEYIDDEISENASEYWGDMSVVKGWQAARCANEYSFWGEEFLQNYHRNESYPEACKVFGIAVYYGYVAIKNRFRVYTGDAGFGNLAVTMQGFRQHDVTVVSVAHVRNGIYEVTYQVMTVGYYLISIRWLDKEIPGNPFVCKVTF